MTGDGALSRLALTDEVAFVTGAGRGLGQAMCVAFAEVGADIVAVSRSADQLEETARRVRATGRQCLPIPCDVTVKAQVDAAVAQALARFGKIDILVNNAGGVTKHYPVEEMPEDEWDRQVNLNLKAAFLCSQAVGKGMLERGRGKILHIGSICGFEAVAGISPYNAAKAGLHNFTKGLALEWGPKGIWVNCIAPGGIRTAASDGLRADRIRRGMTVSTLAASKRDRPPSSICMAEPDEYVPIALFLVSSASDHLTGEIISPGGVALKRT